MAKYKFHNIKNNLKIKKIETVYAQLDNFALRLKYKITASDNNNFHYIVYSNETYNINESIGLFIIENVKIDKKSIYVDYATSVYIQDKDNLELVSTKTFIITEILLSIVFITYIGAVLASGLYYPH